MGPGRRDRGSWRDPPRGRCSSYSATVAERHGNEGGRHIVPSGCGDKCGGKECRHLRHNGEQHNSTGTHRSDGIPLRRILFDHHLSMLSVLTEFGCAREEPVCRKESREEPCGPDPRLAQPLSRACCLVVIRIVVITVRAIADSGAGICACSMSRQRKEENAFPDPLLCRLPLWF